MIKSLKNEFKAEFKASREAEGLETDPEKLDSVEVEKYTKDENEFIENGLKRMTGRAHKYSTIFQIATTSIQTTIDFAFSWLTADDMRAIKKEEGFQAKTQKEEQILHQIIQTLQDGMKKFNEVELKIVEDLAEPANIGMDIIDSMFQRA